MWYRSELGISVTELIKQGLARMVYDEEDIKKRVKELADEISSHYTADDQLVMIGLLKGSAIFMADLVRQMSIPVEMEYLKASSYKGTMSTGKVRFSCMPEQPWNRNVIIVEDIIDSGLTITATLERIRAYRPKSLEVCTLLDKNLSDVSAKYVGFNAPNDFLIGYGLDHNDRYRHLPYIASI
tara:strand:- start:1720 stop:2268 length:549 start_codon:yes stop_codon:yes gene_type:complete